MTSKATSRMTCLCDEDGDEYVFIKLLSCMEIAYYDIFYDIAN